MLNLHIPLKSQFNLLTEDPEKIESNGIFEIIHDFVYNLYFSEEKKYIDYREKLKKLGFSSIMSGISKYKICSSRKKC